jgi:uncharacterized repeat protein (TIGR03803 family)
MTFAKLPKILMALVVVFAAFPIAGAQTFTVLYAFTGENGDGAHPFAGLMMDAQGNLYGTTAAGGDKFNYGTAYKLAPDGTETVLHVFSGGGNAFPNSDLVFDAKGDLYGTSFGAMAVVGGSVFELETNGTEKVFYRFQSYQSGAHPYAGMVTDAQGNFYGTATKGGSPGLGTIFKLTPKGVQTVLHNFTGTPDGDSPYGRLLIDAKGNLYGTTNYGGTAGAGTVFKLAPDGTETILHSFLGTPDGSTPQSGLIVDSQGNLYGTTSAGGIHSEGTIFEITASGKEKVLHSFTGASDGRGPVGELAMDVHGNLYGTANSGGGVGCATNLGCGAVFELTKNRVFSVLHAFTGGTDGAYPASALIFDKNGNLYGTASNGGSTACKGTGCGVVFKLTP